MIVITGMGRSGTSALAKVYQAAGVDPGGEWVEHLNAGLEDAEVVALNRQIEAALGSYLMGTPPVPTRLRKLRNKLPESLTARSPARRSRRGFPGIDWTVADATAARLGERLRAVAASRQLCKSPLFCTTMPVWLAAGAPIEHVVVTTRRLDDAIHSRDSAAMLRKFHTMSDARNSVIYAMGNLFVALADHEVPTTLLRYPDWIVDAAATAAALPKPADLDAATLERALRATADESLVHSGRPAGPTTA